MTFLAPGLLWGLALVPLLLLAYLLAQRRRPRYTVRFTNLEVLAGVAGRTSAWRRHLPAACFLLALTAMLLGLARPQGTVSVPAEQATVMLVMDRSGSMRAVDVEPTRLAAAQQAAGRFLDLVPRHFKVGLVAFSDTAQTVAPPTTDRRAVQAALRGLEADGGTAIGSSIQEALASIQPVVPPAQDPDQDQAAPAAIVLLSDGANSEGPDPLQAAAAARSRGVPVFTIALGTPGGVIQQPGRFGGPSIIRVPPDPETLQEVAATTGGRFFTAPSNDELESIYERLGSRIGLVTERQEITVALAAVALVLLLVAGILGARWLGRLP